jgi:hypothetical protein
MKASIILQLRSGFQKNGWQALISAEARISIPTGPYFPRITIQPDLVAYKKEQYSEKNSLY